MSGCCSVENFEGDLRPKEAPRLNHGPSWLLSLAIEASVDLFLRAQRNRTMPARFRRDLLIRRDGRGCGSPRSWRDGDR